MRLKIQKQIQQKYLQTRSVKRHASMVTAQGSLRPQPFGNHPTLLKDEAIEIIQTGPPEIFSSVLRNYLSQQAHSRRETSPQQNQSLPQSQQRSQLNL